MYLMQLTKQSLIGKGYLPQELPPGFTTKDLAAAYNTLSSQIGTCLQAKRRSRCCPFSIPRPQGLRRLLEVPNPLHQIRLSSTLAQNWTSIAAFISSSPLSLSTLDIKPDSERAITAILPYGSDLTTERILRSTSARYILRADISRFYHSIYTHVIPWVLHTKDVAKVNRQRNLLGNAIDEDVRNTRDGQTSGIPIGPDTSRIISEVLGIGVDRALAESLPYLYGVRHVDDFYLYFKSRADLEQGYYVLQRVLQDLELEINPSKVTITDISEEVFDSPWVAEARSFRFRSDRRKHQKNDIVSYFELAFNNAKKYPKEAVLKYSLTKIGRQKVREQNWGIYEALLLRSMLIEPNVLPVVLEILLNYNNAGFPLNRVGIKNTLLSLIGYHGRLGHIYEVAWALWFAISTTTPLSEEALKIVGSIDNSIIILIALDLESRGLSSIPLDRTGWRQHLNSDDLYSDHWLTAYEANLKGWILPNLGKERYIDNDPFFSLLKQEYVSFYNPDQQIQVRPLFEIDDAREIDVEDIMERH